MKQGDIVIFPANLPISREKRAFQYEIMRRCECGKINCWIGQLPNKMEMHFTPDKARIVKTKEDRAEEELLGVTEDDIKKVDRKGEGL